MSEREHKEVLIIIPAYNEEKNIGDVLDSLTQAGITEFADILVVNDASTDATNARVKEKGCTLISNVFNMGYGSAIRIGYKWAVRRNYRCVIQMDADGQHDICNIPVIYEKLKTKDAEGHYPDIVLGSRFMEGSKAYPVGGLKKIAYRFLNYVIRKTCGQTITDPTTGLQGLSSRAFLYYSQYHHFDDRYPDADMIIQMKLLGFKLEEIPAVMHERKAGESMHSGLKPILYMIRMCFSVTGVLFRIKVLKQDVEMVKDELMESGD